MGNSNRQKLDGYIIISNLTNTSDITWNIDDLQILPQLLNSRSRQLVEAKGWIVNQQGRLELVAEKRSPISSLQLSCLKNES